ncbi:unnamed protein product [Nezara viridula]|uniref:Uncharacterized protein n=1 Tax=Nezara viridula TaxID=85310 RepID=A0A9P0HK49_NEZVI|nr:unnamed protein product [Nezara viridula]
MKDIIRYLNRTSKNRIDVRSCLGDISRCQAGQCVTLNDVENVNTFTDFLTSINSLLHSALPVAYLLQRYTPRVFRSASTSSSHRSRGLLPAFVHNLAPHRVVF